MFSVSMGKLLKPSHWEIPYRLNLIQTVNKPQTNLGVLSPYGGLGKALVGPSHLSPPYILRHRWVQRMHWL